MGKTTNNHLLPAGTGPERAPILQASEGPVPAGKKLPRGSQPAIAAIRRCWNGRCGGGFRPSTSCKSSARPMPATSPANWASCCVVKGLYSSHLSTWRTQREQGTLDALAPKKRGRKPRDNDPLIEENRRLQA